MPFLAAEGYPAPMLALPPVVGAAIFCAIQLGERARTKDRERLRVKAARLGDGAAAGERSAGRRLLGRVILKLFFAVPLIGWMAKDLIHGPDSSKVYFAVSLGLLAIVSVYFFGYPALIIYALTMVAVIFAGLFALTAA